MDGNGAQITDCGADDAIRLVYQAGFPESVVTLAVVGGNTEISVDGDVVATIVGTPALTAADIELLAVNFGNSAATVGGPEIAPPSPLVVM